MNNLPVQFENQDIRRVFDEKSQTWFLSVVDIIQVLIQQPDYQAARNYWKVLKNRLGKEGSESVIKCNRLKLPAPDGKNYLTDVASAETLLRLAPKRPESLIDAADCRQLQISLPLCVSANYNTCK